MKIDLMKYTALVPICKALADRQKETLTPVKLAGELGRATSSPAIVACYLVARELGMSPDLEERIKKLVEFYGYTKVNGVNELMNFGKTE